MWFPYFCGSLSSESRGTVYPMGDGIVSSANQETTLTHTHRERNTRHNERHS